MGKNSDNRTLGKALVRSRFNKSAIQSDGVEKWVHTADLNDGADWNRLNLTSVTEQSSLDDFLTTAELAGTQFEAERLNVNFVEANQNVGVLNQTNAKTLKALHEKYSQLLSIPRRPFWKTKEYDAQTLQLKERESFLEWRRNLAKYQDIENLKMTPFEKNLEFWRQLWRVIERSDVVIQIVDARNPLLFYCQDLEKYVKEVDEKKMNVVLINKSDYLSDRQRLEWYRYFNSKRIKVIFWSAMIATEDTLLSTIGESEMTESETEHPNENESGDVDEEDFDDEADMRHSISSSKNGGDGQVNVNKFNFLLDEKSSQEDETETEDESEEASKQSANDGEQSEKATNEELNINAVPISKQEDCEEKKVDETKEANLEDEIETKLKELNITDEEREKCRILNRNELIQFMKTVYTCVDKCKPGVTTIGLVGYPNVGKSSTINAILQTKKVAVSETPGKTKHYQTLFIDEDLILCDCPGLVFPSFVSTRGELIVNGILPVDQMRDFVEPINLVLNHIPRNIIEMVYGIRIPKPREDEDPNRVPTAEELCTSYSKFRGYMNQKGMPDTNRGSRYILKDYVNGKLLYCYPPPTIVDSTSFQDFKYNMVKEQIYLERKKKREEIMSKQGPIQTEFDQEFFKRMEPEAKQKGGITGYYRYKMSMPVGSNLSIEQTRKKLDNEMIEVGGKPWKKHFNQKRDKLRRKTSHFDQHD